MRRFKIIFCCAQQIVVLMNKKGHLALLGLQKIISLKASMNLGLPALLKTAFPYITPAIRPKRSLRSIQEILNSKFDPY
jgi:hypothetical protein